MLNLPWVGTGDIGVWFTIVKLGAGNVIIDAADSDVRNKLDCCGISWDLGSYGSNYHFNNCYFNYIYDD